MPPILLRTRFVAKANGCRSMSERAIIRQRGRNDGESLVFCHNEEGGMSVVEQKVREFILENFMFTDDGSALSSEESLLEKGVIDSTGVMELVAFLEDEYRIKVHDDELMPENLDSVRNIVAFVGSKTVAN